MQYPLKSIDGQMLSFMVSTNPENLASDSIVYLSPCRSAWLLLPTTHVAISDIEAPYGRDSGRSTLRHVCMQVDRVEAAQI